MKSNVYGSLSMKSYIEAGCLGGTRITLKAPSLCRVSIKYTAKAGIGQNLAYFLEDMRYGEKS